MKENLEDGANKLPPYEGLIPLVLQTLLMKKIHQQLPNWWWPQTEWSSSPPNLTFTTQRVPQDKLFCF